MTNSCQQGKLNKYEAWVGAAFVVANILSIVPSDSNTAQAAGATLFFSPNQGEYLVDSTFDVSLVVNTGGQAINAIEAFVSFPADKLQVVNPSVASSFISIWVAGPSYSNSSGTLSFQGGLPQPGVTTSAGVISTVKFRAKSSGKATIKFSDNSRVLANDGKGTDILTARSSSNLDIRLSPPAGPVVHSSSHEDPNKWYSNRTIALAWQAPAGAIDYSYVFDTNTSTVPDEITEGSTTSLSKSLDSDGRWFFHIRARNSEGWGGTTHFHAKIDGSPPARFTPRLEPRSPTEGSRSILTFSTTDSMSGMDHYELKIISNSVGEEATFFVEQVSPFQMPELKNGKYSVIVRAIDAAGNYTDEQLDFEVGALASLVNIPNKSWLFLIAGALIAAIMLLAIYWLVVRRRASRAALQTNSSTGATNIVQGQNAGNSARLIKRSDSGQVGSA